MVTSEAVPRNSSEAEVTKIGVARSVVRLLPAFALVAVLATAIGLLLRLPLPDIAAVMGVPLFIVFIVSRLGVLLVPRNEPNPALGPREERELRYVRLSPLFNCGMSTLLIGGGLSILLALSAGGYRIIGLYAYVGKSLHFSLIGLQVAVAGLALLLLEHFVDRHAARAVYRTARAVELNVFWFVHAIPTRLAPESWRHHHRHS